jgi:aminoglycoside 6'-N-acetyltransferase I
MPGDVADWTAMRTALWPHGADDHATEIEGALRHTDGLNLIARLDGEAVGFAEACMRHDYVNGCDTSPVAFVEGIYVAPQFRRRGVAGRLVQEIETWARMQGVSELASDAPLDNHQSQAMHRALGFGETQRVVYFRKALR